MQNELAAICKKLKLGDLTKLATQVTFENETQYLTDVLRLALKHREDKRIERLIRQAKFPVVKTFDGYKYDPITWPHGFDKEQLLSLDFIEKKQNIICLGAVGTGKTYLAIALGVNTLVGLTLNNSAWRLTLMFESFRLMKSFLPVGSDNFFRFFLSQSTS